MKIHFSAEGIELTGELERYVNGKVAHLNRRLPRKWRPMASCSITCRQIVKKKIKHNTCNMILSFDGTELKAEETTQHMYAALDIAAVHIEQQLKDHLRHRHDGGFLRRHFRAG